MVNCKHRTHPSQGCWESWPLSTQGYPPWGHHLPSTRHQLPMRGNYRHGPGPKAIARNLHPFVSPSVLMRGKRKEIRPHRPTYPRLLGHRGHFPATKQFCSCGLFGGDGSGWLPFRQPGPRPGTCGHVPAAREGARGVGGPAALPPRPSCSAGQRAPPRLGPQPGWPGPKQFSVARASGARPW